MSLGKHHPSPRDVEGGGLGPGRTRVVREHHRRPIGPDDHAVSEGDLARHHARGARRILPRRSVRGIAALAHVVARDERGRRGRGDRQAPVRVRCGRVDRVIGPRDAVGAREAHSVSADRDPRRIGVREGAEPVGVRVGDRSPGRAVRRRERLPSRGEKRPVAERNRAQELLVVAASIGFERLIVDPGLAVVDRSNAASAVPDCHEDARRGGRGIQRRIERRVSDCGFLGHGVCRGAVHVRRSLDRALSCSQDRRGPVACVTRRRSGRMARAAGDESEGARDGACVGSHHVFRNPASPPLPTSVFPNVVTPGMPKAWQTETRSRLWSTVSPYSR